MKIKSICSLLLVFLLAFSLLVSCKEKHTHEYSDKYSTDGDSHWYACECGEKKDTAAHTFDEGVITVYPTTESEGQKIFTCSVCGYEKNETIAKLEAGHTHSYDSVKKNESIHWHECICGEKSGSEGHTFGEGVVTVEPTLESEGVRTYTCTECGLEKTETIGKLDPDHEHSFSTEASDEKYHWIQCTCGEMKDKTAHAFDEGVTTTPANEKEIGIFTYTCTECGHKATENIPSSAGKGLSFRQSTHNTIKNLLSATPLTLEAEICVDPSVTGRAGAVFGNYYGIRQDWLLEIYENGVPRFYYTDAAGNINDLKFTNVDVRTGEFVHIALTFDFENNAVSFYLDGEIAQVLPCNIDLAPDITRYPFVLGGDNRSNNGIFFRGQIRSISAYSDVRSADEIAASAEKGANLYADDLILSYLLSENCDAEDIIDLSGNGYTIPKEWLDSHEPTIDYAYSFAVVGDTQWLSKYKPAKMEGIYDWIIENKDEKKMAHVFGLGDITEDWNTTGKEAEWVQAQQFISKLNGVIPYSLIRGNHDESKYFNKYFATEAYMSQYGGSYMVEGDIRNSYKLFTVGTTDYMLLTLDFGASDEMLAWANEVVLAHPDRRVIVTTHGYMGFDGGHLSYDNVPGSGDINSGSDVDTSVGGNVRSYNNGKAIWEKFVSLHPNIAYVLCGHTSMEDVLVLESKGVHGNTVVQMLIDPQWIDPQKDGVGMVCMLYFTEDGSQMEVEWICTDTGKYYREHNQFTMNVSDYFDVEGHDFKDSYNADYHYKACDCGYTYDEQGHEFDGGTLNADGFMVYKCECGYERVTSATDDPVAKALQEMLDKYYSDGRYYLSSSEMETLFFGGDKFWTDDASDYKLTADYLTLHDLVMGRSGDLKLDLGWNYLEGVYSSSNESTVNGIRMILLGLEKTDTSSADATKATVEENGYQAVIKLYNGDSLLAEATVGVYATATLVDHRDNQVIDEIYTKADANGIITINTPAVNGLVSEYDKIILDARHDSLERTVYYSTVSVWDGVSVSSSLQGSGTLEDPFLINSGADLAYLAEVVNNAAEKTPNFSGKYFVMTQSIDLNGYSIAIGSYPGWGTRRGFFGMFDGNHCTVRGLNAAKPLFGTIETGYLKNLSVYGTITNKGGIEAVGGIVSYAATGAVIENLTSYVNVTGISTLGGVIGNAEDNASTVKNCVNYGTVIGSQWNIGGIAGSGGHDVIGCVNFGNVSSTGSDNVGGIAGSTKNTGSISECRNYGSISTVHGRSGGIVGLCVKTVKNCINYGTVSTGWDSGGIVGYLPDGASAAIIGCVNYGKVSGGTGIGGIFGMGGVSEGELKAQSVIITDCVNYGEVSGTWGVGGIAANTQLIVNAEISGCENYGYLTAKGELGGIVGKCSGKVTECTNYGEVNGAQDIIGGIVGYLHDATYLEMINTTNYQQGTVIGPNSKDIIGKQS